MNNIAVRQNIPFGYFSLEMSAASLTSRSIFIEGVIEKTLISEDKTIPREKQISKIGSVLKSLAADLNIPILLISGVKKLNESKVPTVDDLGPYRGLFEYANYIMLLHGEKWEENIDGSFTRLESESEINISNKINGPLGTVSLKYNPKTIMFEEIE